MPSSNIIYEKTGHIGRITINRPNSANRINIELAQELEEACVKANQDDNVYAVMLTGSGDSHFCGGSDGVQADIAVFVAAIDKPVVAAINGEAVDEGLELALACDIRIASENAAFKMGQIGSGRIPTSGGTQRLPRIVGKGKAMELILTGEAVSAKEAFDIGLVSKVVPAPNLAAEADAIVQKMAGQAPISLRFVKEAVNKGMDMSLDQGLRLEGDLYFLIHTTGDRTEGIKAFLEKRKAEFKGK